MYLADSMIRIVEGLDGQALAAMPANARFMVGMMRRILRDYALYGFEPSALAVASDLRMDTPERLEAVFEAVLEHPRRVFVEAVYADRVAMMGQMRGYPVQDLKPGRHLPWRVGLAIDVLGGGRARVDVLWNFKKGVGLSRSESLAFAKSQREALVELTRCGVSYHVAEIDLAARGSYDRRDFEAIFSDMLEASGPGGPSETSRAGQLLAAARRIARGREDAPLDRSVMLEAWRMARLNDFCHLVPRPDAREAVIEVAAAQGASVGTVLDDAISDFDGEIIQAMALLAVLEGGGSAIRREVRPPARLKAVDRTSRQRAPAPIANKLAVVRLDLGDIELEAAYASRVSADGQARRKGAVRVRHFVRGHLFRARHGGMVYRRPHWRGSVVRPTLHKVVVT